ncbi:MAG: hypothetical protein J5I94_05335 [Phaeodactylibacter sp.]|nr:hypothetical protein [Phaeodactylibacter sp.]
MKLKLLFITYFFLFLTSLPGRGCTVLRVGLHPAPPFVMQVEEGHYEGLCVDLRNWTSASTPCWSTASTGPTGRRGCGSIIWKKMSRGFDF